MPTHRTTTGTATRPTERAKMVRWLHPEQLFRTGVDAMLSSVFGERADRRLIEAVAHPDQTFFNYSGVDHPEAKNEWLDASGTAASGDFWFDYVADAGDGFDSTYAVAYQVSRPTLNLEGVGELKRGSVLLFGGDQVYPVASREEYEQRLVVPYEQANHWTNPPHPHLYAIPGNHDWYDGLASFLRLFAAGRWFAGWKTRQTRSYFALKLPHNWWVLGTDVQLSSDIDAAQVKYFREIAERHIGPQDRIILLNAEPSWVYGATPKITRSGYIEHNLAYLEQNVLQQRVQVFIAGDLHHYRRHEHESGVQRITCGGGGAFLHPTHAPKVETLNDGSTLKKAFPSIEQSRSIGWRTLGLIKSSPLFGLITASLYLVLALTARAEVGEMGLGRFGEVVGAVTSAAILRPWSLGLGILFLLGCIGFADARYGPYGRALAGTLHAAAHLVAAFFIAWGATYLTVTTWDICTLVPPASCAEGALELVKKFALASSLTFLGGWLIGTLILSVYLTISVNLFGRHGNEAFGGMAIPDWKSFLRLKIDPSGLLTVYAVGLEAVPRRWREAENPRKGEAELEPVGGSSPQLLEEVRVTVR